MDLAYVYIYTSLLHNKQASLFSLFSIIVYDKNHW